MGEVMQLCTKIQIIELSEPDMFDQVQITRAKFIGTDIVGDDHRHDSGFLAVGDYACVRSGPLYLRSPAVGKDCDET